MIYYSVPQPVVATYSSTMLVGFNALDVQTEEHAYVALSMNGTLLDAKVAGPSGLVNLSFSPLTNVGNADIVVIKQNRKPHINQIGVVPATGPYVVVQNVAVNDSLGNNNGMADFDEDIFLNVTFKNVGVQTATNVETRYQTADNNLDLIDSTQSIASIAPNSTKYVRNAYRMKVASFVQDQHKVEYLMTMTDGTNNWSFENKLTLNAPVLQVLGLTIDDATTGNNNGILDAGETVKVKVQTKNVGHTLVLNTPCNLSVAAGSENYLLVTNPNYVIPSLGVNQTKEAEFTVMSNIITPAMTEAGLVYQILAGSQGQYSAVSTLPVIVGENPSVNFTSSKTMNVCSANFFDGGGPDNNYAINQTDTITFMPATPGAKLKVTFTEFNV
ncbi:MAG TPA: C25 family peptidase C-terminal domain-containing protein, partial [Bacteroidales bacterium]|nr:C25 family peptidase C-terminal domain-containing protein [Bacteroidales bacterium]